MLRFDRIAYEKDGRFIVTEVVELGPADIADGVVIDVRNNNGGFVNVYALDILSRRNCPRSRQPRGISYRMIRDYVRLTVLLIALTLLLPAGLASQTIRGVVLEEGTNVPIVGVTIELLGPDSTPMARVTSDRNGWFEANVKEAAEYRLRPSHLAYTATGLDETVSVGRHEIVTVVLRMGRTVIPLQPLVVTARTFDRLAGFYQRSETNKQGKFIHRPFIEARVASLPSQLLMMTPGVRVTRSADNMSYVITIPGAGGPCIPNIYLDGLPVPRGERGSSPFESFSITIDDLTSSDMIEGVEIYDAYARAPDIFPVTSNGCGIVAFWSRRVAQTRLSLKRVIVGVVSVAAFVVLEVSLVKHARR